MKPRLGAASKACHCPNQPDGSSDVSSDCSSLRLEALDRQLPSPIRSLDQWAFPSARSGLARPAPAPRGRGGESLFREQQLHGAATPAADIKTRFSRGLSGGMKAAAAAPPSSSLLLQKQHQQQLLRARSVGHVAAPAGVSSGSSDAGSCGGSNSSGGDSNPRDSNPRAATPLRGCFSGPVCCGRCASGGELLLQTASAAACECVALLMNTPTPIEAMGLRFLILDAPNDENLPAYVHAMHNYGVTDLARTCKPTYDASAVTDLRVHDLSFPDGEAPPPSVINKWRALVSQVSAEGGAIAVHCVAGLGRAPVLVALALIDKGMEADEAVLYIRARRRGEGDLRPGEGRICGWGFRFAQQCSYRCGGCFVPQEQSIAGSYYSCRTMLAAQLALVVA